MTFSSSLTLLRLKPVIAGAGNGLVEAQLAPVLERILRPYHRAGRHVEPIDETGKQKSQRRAAREQRQRRTFRGIEWARSGIGLHQGAPLGYVEGMVRLEAPGIET